ncbi:hypothetical protein LTS03_009873 [Exophiala xenobiotica]|nr:hypothetical protein LTR41_010290 [Exophiala xenobiotica]KAK5346573.1 hypothetical protein LTR61_009776 [Exophiala xenobiotica]KAK5358436.1 hypothetical protein LTR11_010952 [Exophiala xenobiotica]KAK5362927.1 hypothetical protein LTS03_009873 [Exophiala xenobiotica]
MSKEKAERKYTSLACLECRKRKIKTKASAPLYTDCLAHAVRLSETVRRRGSTSKDTAKNVESSNHIGTRNEGSLTVENGVVDVQLPWTDLDLSSLMDETQQSGLVDHGAQHGWDLPSTAFDSIGAMSFFAEDSFNQANASTPGPMQAGLGGQFSTNVAHLDWHSQEQSQVVVDIPGFKVPGDALETSPGSVGTSSSNVEVSSSLGPKSKLCTSRPERDAASLNDVTRQLTSRLGRLQITEGGQARYYGATSNLHLLHGSPNSLVQPSIRDVVRHGDAAIAQAGLRWQGDPAYEEHLINLFFSWHNALMYVLDKDIFLNERQKFQDGRRTNLYSPSLENAVFTIGSAYTDRTHPGVNDATDEFFAFRSKIYLEIEIDSPTIATAQALLILSSHEAAHARESRGWIYSGMAVQIMTDLGLHLDLKQEHPRLDTRSLTGPSDVLILRRNLFWSINTIDTLWSAHCGRPSLMKNLRHNVQEPLPSRTYQWEYYTDPYSSLKFPPDFDFTAVAHVHVHLASLMRILARVSDVLYSGVPDISDDIQAFVAQADHDFQDWSSSLPENLQLDMTGATPFHIPAVLELHLSYHECIILLHRPLIAPEDMVFHDRATSLSRCIENAEQICKILVLFRRMYGLRRPHHHMCHITMTAALIHIFCLCVTDGKHENKESAQKHFLTCIQALGEMGQTYKSASRGLDVITSLRQSWQDDTFAGNRFKRAKLG